MKFFVLFFTLCALFYYIFLFIVFPTLRKRTSMIFIISERYLYPYYSAITLGILQGSIRSPFSFFMYISDLPYYVWDAHFRPFIFIVFILFSELKKFYTFQVQIQLSTLQIIKVDMDLFVYVNYLIIFIFYLVIEIFGVYSLSEALFCFC